MIPLSPKVDTLFLKEASHMFQNPGKHILGRNHGNDYPLKVSSQKTIPNESFPNYH